MIPVKSKSVRAVLFVAMGALGAVGLILAATSRGDASPAAAKTSARACIDINNSLSRQVVGKNTLRLDDGLGRSAILTLSQPCSNMDDFDRIGFEMAGSNQLCGAHDMKILYSRNGEAPLTCLITSVKVLGRGQKDESTEQSSAASS